MVDYSSYEVDWKIDYRIELFGARGQEYEEVTRFFKGYFEDEVGKIVKQKKYLRN